MKYNMTNSSDAREHGMIMEKLEHIDNTIINMTDEIKENSKFRIQSKTIFGVAMFIATVFGGAIIWIGQKILGK